MLHLPCRRRACAVAAHLTLGFVLVVAGLKAWATESLKTLGEESGYYRV